MAETILANMRVLIAANTAEFNKALNKSSNDFNKFTSGIKRVAGTIGVAFGVQQVASFAFEVSKLAGEAEGVAGAFNKLEDSQKLLQRLKEETGNTVSELELMKRTVQASNFGIGLEQLPELFKFATLRAQQTGQSVEYLVDSIVTGIGRKSPLILDNLGISAVRLREKFKGIGVEAVSVADVTKAVGEIASEELKNMASFSDNASTRVQQLNATWENFKVTLGSSQFTSGITKGLDETLQFFTVLFGGKLSGKKLNDELDFLLDNINKLAPSTEGYALALDEAGKVADQLGVKLIKLRDRSTGLIKVLVDDRTKINIAPAKETQEQIKNLEYLQAQLKALNEQFSETDTADKKKLSNIGQEIISTQALIENIEKYRKKQKEATEAKRRDIDESQFQIRGLLDTATAFNQTAEAAEKAASEISKFINAINPVATLPQKINPSKGFKDQIKIMLKDFDDAGKQIETKAIEISGLIESSIVGLADALGTALATGDFKNFGKSLLEAVASFAQQLGALMIASGIAQVVLETGAGGPYGQIAAGVALVAAGAAIKGLLGKQKSLVSSSGGATTGGSSGGRSANTSTVNASAQDTRIAVDDVQIRGQDIWLSFQAYQSNGKYTKTVNG